MRTFLKIVCVFVIIGGGVEIGRQLLSSILAEIIREPVLVCAFVVAIVFLWMDRGPRVEEEQDH